MIGCLMIPFLHYHFYNTTSEILLYIFPLFATSLFVFLLQYERYCCPKCGTGFFVNQCQITAKNLKRHPLPSKTKRVYDIQKKTIQDENTYGELLSLVCPSCKEVFEHFYTLNPTVKLENPIPCEPCHHCNGTGKIDVHVNSVEKNIIDSLLGTKDYISCPRCQGVGAKLKLKDNKKLN